MSFAARTERLFRRPCLVVLALAATCFGLLLVPSAEAEILPHRGIDGIALNMTRAEVVAAKGKPDAERLVRNEIIGPQRMLRYGQTRAYFGGFRRDAGVVTVNTRDRRQRTPSGVGIGSTVAQVKAGIGGIRCLGQARVHSCIKGRFLAGERVTVVDISPAGRATFVLIGFVID